MPNFYKLPHELQKQILEQLTDHQLYQICAGIVSPNAVLNTLGLSKQDYPAFMQARREELFNRSGKTAIEYQSRLIQAWRHAANQNQKLSFLPSVIEAKNFINMLQKSILNNSASPAKLKEQCYLLIGALLVPNELFHYQVGIQINWMLLKYHPCDPIESFLPELSQETIDYLLPVMLNKFLRDTKAPHSKITQPAALIYHIKQEYIDTLLDYLISLLNSNNPWLCATLAPLFEAAIARASIEKRAQIANGLAYSLVHKESSFVANPKSLLALFLPYLQREDLNILAHVVPVITAALSDQNIKTQDNAISLICTLESMLTQTEINTLSDPLLALLNGSDINIALSAAHAANLLGSRLKRDSIMQALNELLVRLNSPVNSTRKNAANLLGLLAGSTPNPENNAIPVDRHAEVADHLMRLMFNDIDAIQQTANYSLMLFMCKLTPNEINRLTAVYLDRLRGNCPHSRVLLSQIFNYVSTPSVISTVLDFLITESDSITDRVSRASYQDLELISNRVSENDIDKVLDCLLNGIRVLEDKVRWNAIVAIGKLPARLMTPTRTHKAIDALLKVIMQHNAPHKGAALDALSALLAEQEACAQIPAIIHASTRFLSDRDENMNKAAMRLIARIGKHLSQKDFSYAVKLIAEKLPGSNGANSIIAAETLIELLPFMMKKDLGSLAALPFDIYSPNQLAIQRIAEIRLKLPELRNTWVPPRGEYYYPPVSNDGMILQKGVLLRAWSATKEGKRTSLDDCMTKVQPKKGSRECRF